MSGAPSIAPELQPCWYCPHYGGLTAGGTAAWCTEGRVVQVAPEWGCARWSRVPGVDDEPWAPAGWRPLKPELVSGVLCLLPR